MPIYEYECKRCGHRFELIQKFSDQPRRRCPECRGAVERLISPSAIRFKGTGWYVTDYADKGKKQKAESAEGSSGADSKEGDKGAGKKKEKSEKSESKKKDQKAS